MHFFLIFLHFLHLFFYSLNDTHISFKSSGYSFVVT